MREAFDRLGADLRGEMQTFATELRGEVQTLAAVIGEAFQKHKLVA